MTNILINISFVFLYLILIASLIRLINAKIFNKIFPTLHQTSKLTILMVLPLLLLIPLSESFYELIQVKDIFELSFTDIMSKYSIMVLAHLSFSVVGIFLMLFAGRIIFQQIEQSEKEIQFSYTLALLILSSVLAFVLFPSLREVLAEIIPQTEIKSFR